MYPTYLSKNIFIVSPLFCLLVCNFLRLFWNMADEPTVHLWSHLYARLTNFKPPFPRNGPLESSLTQQNIVQEGRNIIL